MTDVTAEQDHVTVPPSVESLNWGAEVPERAPQSGSGNGVEGVAPVAAHIGARHTPNTLLPVDASPDIQALLDTGDGRDRKKLGIYYTPSGAARILCTWAIRDASDRVLEPSFGACGFLEAARDQLAAVGATRPQDRLYGCDVDLAAFEGYLQPRLGLSVEDGRFFHRDFLLVRPEDFAGGAFDVIVGNPPYISYHNMDAVQRMVSDDAAIRAGYCTGPKSSLWAHFLLYSMAFLNEGGRMAWLLPSSFLFAEYSTRVREQIAKRFKQSLVVQLGQRLFLSEGTEESTAVLLADGYLRDGDPTVGSPLVAHPFLIDFAETLPELDRGIKVWQQGRTRARPFEGRAAAAHIGATVVDALETAAAVGYVVRLGDITDIRIGIVTGANPFFVIDAATAEMHGLDDDVLRPILAKFAMAPGVALTNEDLANARTTGGRLLLINTDHKDAQTKGSALRRYLATFPRSKRRSNRTFTKRELWHRPDDGRTPDAFFPYMYQHGPRLILNGVGTTSTNTIHRAYFKDPVFGDGEGSEGATALRETLSPKGWARMCAVSILSTFSQLSGELQGRSYGAGVLKHEPSEAARIRMILPRGVAEDDVKAVFHDVDRSLRSGDAEAARATADRFVLLALPAEERKATLIVLTEALTEARRRRHPLKRVSGSQNSSKNDALGSVSAKSRGED